MCYVRDEGCRVAFETRTLNEFLDFEPILARFLRMLLARAREGTL